MHRLWRGLLKVLIIILNASSVRTFAQTPAIIQHYTSENGLPANGVTSLELDQRSGFLWVGTQAGLVRFDGHSFKGFDPSKQNSTAFRVAMLAKNRQGTVFCEDDNYSVYRIVNNEPRFEKTDSVFIPAPGLPPGGFNQGTGRQVVSMLKRHRPSEFLPEFIEFDSAGAGKANFAFIYFGKGYYYDISSDSVYSLDGCSSLARLGKDVCFVRQNSLFRFDRVTRSFNQVKVQGLDPGRGDAMRLLWKRGMPTPILIRGNDMFELVATANKGSLRQICSDCIPSNAQISSAQIWPEQGTIFLGSQVSGLYVLRRRLMRTMTDVYSGTGGQYEYGQAEVAGGLVNTSSGAVFTSEGHWLNQKAALNFRSKNIYKSSNGDFWFSSADTVIHRHTASGKYARIPINDGSFRFVFAESGKRVFMFSDFAIAEVTRDHCQILYRLPPLSQKTLGNSFMPDDVIEYKPGIFAVAGGKLIFFDINKRIHPDTVDIPGVTAKIRGLRKVGEYLLVGTYGQGFYIYKDGKTKKMPLDKSGYLSTAHCFMLDGKGYCWISTNRGLFKVSVQALLAAYENDLKEIYYHYFGKGDGIINSEFNGGCQPCALRLSSGKLSFPSMNGMVIFDPLQYQSGPPKIHFVIEEISTDSAKWVPDDSQVFKVPFANKELRFTISLPYFGNAENLYFSYKLDGYHQNWLTQELLQNKVLQFGQLDPGRYKLFLRVRNGFGPSQFHVRKIQFEVLTPWFQTWWFYTFCGIGLAILVWMLVKWRTARIMGRKRQLQEQVQAQTRDLAGQSKQLARQLAELEAQQIRLKDDNIVKARLIAIITHDLISPLKFIGFMSKKLSPAFPETDPNYQTATFISNIAHDLESLSVNMLNWIRFHHDSFRMVPETFSVKQMLAQSVEIAKTLADEKGVKLNLHADESVHVTHYPQAIGIILYNLIMNALKYTNEGEITVIAEQLSDKLVFSVRDTGIGMTAELVDRLNKPEAFVSDYSAATAKKYQFGYVLIKDLLKMANGELRVESWPGKGTIVWVEFTFGKVGV
jgi:signal transduction histidine kinase